MRIISGKYKGLQLVSFKADHVRPTTDRVKETQFNKLIGYTEGARVLDLFCGTGNLGLEALSRGAKEVYFVDLSKKSLQITRENIEKLKVPRNECRIINEDVLDYLKEYKGDAFDLIFIDPPFTKKMAHEVMQGIAKSAVFAQGTIITIESERRERMEDHYDPLARYDVREFGDKVLSFFSKKDDNKADG
jgi:16S rRNA (guanine966-N2)-methyltransferase